jgi:subtilisin
VDNLLPGTNFVQPGKDPIDGLGHGTHVTGILVAENNEIGIVGVCPKAKVRPVKVLDNTGNGNMGNVAAGIRWATDQGVDFISMSLGAPFKVQEVRKAIQYALSKGVVTFCAAGNAGSTKEIMYPANYPETIAIGAIDSQSHRATFSCTGRNLDFLAPGVDILSTVPPNWYAVLSGTSMAQPFACGVAALLLSYARKTQTEQKFKTNQDYLSEMKKYTIPSSDTYKDPEFYQGFGIIDPRKYSEAMGWTS